MILKELEFVLFFLVLFRVEKFVNRIFLSRKKETHAHREREENGLHI